MGQAILISSLEVVPTHSHRLAGSPRATPARARPPLFDARDESRCRRNVAPAVATNRPEPVVTYVFALERSRALDVSNARAMGAKDPR